MFTNVHFSVTAEVVIVPEKPQAVGFDSGQLSI
jgi:hypothetical protein